MTGLLVEDVGAVRLLSIDRPAKRNALTLEVVDHLADALTDLPGTARAVVLTGVGDHFSAGGDASTVLTAVETDTTDAMMRTFHRAVRALNEVPVPVVAAVFGSVYGGAFNLALACDVVVAARDARFCQVFLRLGVVPDLGGAYFLARAVGTQRAGELVLSARVVEADEALRLGIVGRVTPTRNEAVAEARSLAETLGTYSAEAVAGTVQLLRAGRDLDLEGLLDREAAVQSRVLMSEEARAGFSAVGRRA